MSVWTRIKLGVRGILHHPVQGAAADRSSAGRARRRGTDRLLGYRRERAVQLLALLQREGRLIDFVRRGPRARTPTRRSARRRVTSTPAAAACSTDTSRSKPILPAGKASRSRSDRISRSIRRRSIWSAT